MSDKQNPSYYAILEADVRYDNELKANEKLLYAEITALSNKDGHCWATNKYFGNLFDVTKVTISRWIKKLTEKGYINRKLIRKDNKEVKKRILTPINKNVNTSPQNNQEGINRNVKGNTTSNNTTSNNIYKLWDEKMKTMISANQKQTLNSYLDELPLEVIEVALQRTKDNASQKGYYHYCKKILDNWVEEGVEELSDIDRLDDEHNGNIKEKPRRASDRRETDYTTDDLEGLWDD